MTAVEVRNLEIRPEEDRLSAEVDVMADADGVQINLLIDGSVSRRINIERNEQGRIILKVVEHCPDKEIARVELEDKEDK